MNKDQTHIPATTSPNVLIQANDIIRAVQYIPSAYVKRLIWMGIYAIKDGADDYTVQFDIKDVMNVLDLEPGANTRAKIRQAVVDCQKALIEVDTPQGLLLINWFSYSFLSRNSEQKGSDVSPSGNWYAITMKFNADLGPMLVKLKKDFTRLEMKKLGKLQSMYAQRIYENLMTRFNQRGQKGQKKGCWYYDFSIENLRAALGIKANAYPRMNTFREKVIDRSIKEINEAAIGIWIEPEYQRKGRNLVGVRFNCQEIKPGDPRPATPATKAEKDAEDLRKTHPEAWEAARAEAETQAAMAPELPGITPKSERDAELDARADTAISGHEAARKFKAAKPANWETGSQHNLLHKSENAS
jgi:hypothetical protein